ncbi:lysophospholipid acyltransferase family protein [bacterium]|nr:lysophospholipid acyltransferase family protein [bacterium]
MGKRIPKYLSPFFATLSFVAARLPFKTSYFLMGIVVNKGGEFFLKPRNMRANLREIFPDLPEPAIEDLTKKILTNFGRHIAEIFNIASFKQGKNGMRIDFSSPEGAVFSGKGPAIYVGAHVGSWELLPLVFTQKNQPLTVIYSENENASLNTLLMHQRQQSGATYLEKNIALKPFYHALDRGESIALLVDQRVSPGIDVTFFDRPTAISRIPARLATNFDCPIIPFEVVRIAPGHLRVVFQEAILPAGRKGKQAELELTQNFALKVQESIVRNADTWFCAKLRWRRSDREKILAQKTALEAGPLSSDAFPAEHLH